MCSSVNFAKVFRTAIIKQLSLKIWNLHYLLLSTAYAMSNMIIDFCFCTRLLIVHRANSFPDNCIWLCWRKTGYLYDWNPGIISLKHLSNTSLCKLLAILHMEAVIRSCSVEKAFLKISHNLQKKFQSFCFNTVTKRKTLTQVFSCSFPVSFAKFLRTFFLQNTLGGCFCTLLIFWKKSYLV